MMHLREEQSSGTTQPSTGFITFFVTFQLVGGILMTLVLLTVLLSQATKVGIYRCPTWYNFVVSWIISAMSYSLLLFTGEQLQPQPPPASEACTIQASLIYGAPVFTTWCTLALTLGLFIHSIRLSTPCAESLPLRFIIPLAVLPYVAYLSVLAITFSHSLSNPSTVIKSKLGIYCLVNDGVPGLIAGTMAAVGIGGAFVFEVLVAIQVLRRQKIYAGARSSIMLLVRLTVFALVSIISVSISLVYTIDFRDGHVANSFMAILPITAFLLFGTQQDIMNLWMIWKRTDGSSSWVV